MQHKDALINALVNEASAEKEYLEGETVNTIYFGGGTPSLLSKADLERVLDTIRQNFTQSSNPEITIEANPDDINMEKLKAWKDIGINRLSIGVQSFFEKELKWMNRAHNAEQAIESLQLAVTEFENITADLIYGSPLLTDEMWLENVERATSFGLPHLSCYALTVEERTPLHKSISARKTTGTDADKQGRQFLLLMQWLREKGYEHYEVSNFAKPGLRSRHNSSYWKREKYLGLGPSAHSYNGKERRWNVSNNNAYIKTVETSGTREFELLTSTQQLNEYIMISLRTMEGLDLEKIESEWGAAEKNKIALRIQKFLRGKMVHAEQSMMRLTDEGMLVADGIASDLFS